MLEMFKVGDRIDGKYEVVEVFPAGGMGCVYRVQTSTSNEYALKVCIHDDPDLRRRFVREVRLMKRVKHSHVIDVIDSGLEHDPPYFLMPVAKGSLLDEISELSADEISAIAAFKQICEGVQAIHNSDVVHRDLKPANALRMSDGRVVVSDLGLAKPSDRDTTVLTQTQAIVGTEAYLAPEQKIPDGSRRADVRTDIYQLGRTLYQLVSGKYPGLVDMSVLSPGIGRIVRRATQEDPGARFQSVAELMDAIAGYELSKDPKRNVAASIQELSNRISERVASGEYRSNELSKLMLLFVEAKGIDKETYANLFDEIPERLLPTLASESSELLAEALTYYVECLDETAGSNTFSYGEFVADRMRTIFLNSQNPETRCAAVEAAMTVAVKLNRFAAMGIFDSMVKSIRDDATAYAVADMLRIQQGQYRWLADRIPEEHLHGAIQVVRREALGDNA